jgi:zinc D-Ala-D-Ala carboxypeptidase
MKITYTFLLVIVCSRLLAQQPNYLNIDYIMGKFEPSTHPDFVKINPEFTNKTNIFLRTEVYNAFLKMYSDAAQKGVYLKIISATRNFDYQKRIWEVKFKKNRIKKVDQKVKDILLFSAMPGSSRHHWGTDVDLFSLDNFSYEKGNGKKIYDWLQKNASKYGFYQPYSAGRNNGYQEEKWHWTYAPTSSLITNYLKTNFKNETIKGFSGAETAVSLDILNNYMLGINPECLEIYKPLY